MSEFQVISYGMSNKQGLSESNNKTIVYFKPSLSLCPGIAQTWLKAFLKLSKIQLSKGKPLGLTWDQAAPSAGKGEKQGWHGESWEMVVEAWACLSPCHPGKTGVTQHHLNPASLTSVSLTVRSSSINKPLETAGLQPSQGIVLDSCQLCRFLKLILGTLGIFSDIFFP